MPWRNVVLKKIVFNTYLILKCLKHIMKISVKSPNMFKIYFSWGTALKPIMYDIIYED